MHIEKSCDCGRNRADRYVRAGVSYRTAPAMISRMGGSETGVIQKQSHQPPVLLEIFTAARVWVNKSALWEACYCLLILTHITLIPTYPIKRRSCL